MMIQKTEKLKTHLQELNPGKNIEKIFEKGMKIGIYGSSFDPVTNVHLWTASTVAHRKKLDYVIFLPSSNKRVDKQRANAKPTSSGNGKVSNWQ